MRYLVENTFLIRNCFEVFDWGHGHGDDMIYLSDLGYAVDGFDPNHDPPQGFYGIHPDKVRETDRVYNWVHCGYVLNVIELPEDRIRVLEDIHKFLPNGGTLSVAVRTAKEVERSMTPHWRPFNDGWITSAGTFQKGFYPFELADMLKVIGFRESYTIKGSPLIALAKKW